MTPRKNSPFRFMTTTELAKEMNLSERAIRSLATWGAPFVSKKSRPELLMDWMREHPEKIGKLD